MDLALCTEALSCRSGLGSVPVNRKCDATENKDFLFLCVLSTSWQHFGKETLMTVTVRFSQTFGFIVNIYFMVYVRYIILHSRVSDLCYFYRGMLGSGQVYMAEWYTTGIPFTSIHLSLDTYKSKNIYIKVHKANLS